jgi:hypothetical protein
MDQEILDKLKECWKAAFFEYSQKFYIEDDEMSSIAVLFSKELLENFELTIK